MYNVHVMILRGVMMYSLYISSYGAKENQEVVDKVIKAVDDDNGGPAKCPWTHAQLKGRHYENLNVFFGTMK